MQGKRPFSIRTDTGQIQLNNLECWLLFEQLCNHFHLFAQLSKNTLAAGSEATWLNKWPGPERFLENELRQLCDRAFKAMLQAEISEGKRVKDQP